MFIMFTYGFALPALFMSCTVALVFLNLVDKILITYWHKPLPL
jgi:hypothetical protein